MKKILIIEDDIGISQSLKIYLENVEFEVFLHHSGEGAVEKIVDISPDLVILDINLPVMSGIDICKKYREEGIIPIIMLTARGGETDKIAGLENGADDYIAKPFSPRELLARIHTILRRYDVQNSDNNSGVLEFKNITIDTEKKQVFLDKNLVSFTANEFDILKTIIEKRGSIVSRESIMTDIIGYDNYVYDRTIDTHIKNIRKKLDDKDIILTVRGEGYRLNI